MSTLKCIFWPRIRVNLLYESIKTQLGTLQNHNKCTLKKKINNKWDKVYVQLLLKTVQQAIEYNYMFVPNKYFFFLKIKQCAVCLRNPLV